ncbi:MAG: response regulator [Cryomorphaceae bacterium]|nr:response regulator transcription factor [Flavobacteriales bacterium]
MIKVGLTDDHELVRRGICDMTERGKYLRVTHCWADADETLEGIAEAEIQVLLLDINLPDMQGDKLCAKVIETCPYMKVIGLSTFDQSVVVKDFIDAGAAGYLTKDASLDDLETAVRTVLDDGQYLIQNIRDRFDKMDPESRAVRLTRREEDILKLVAAEFTTREIADKLCVSEKTVETHRAHLFQKLEVRNIAGLVREAILRGYIS